MNTLSYMIHLDQRDIYKLPVYSDCNADHIQYSVTDNHIPCEMQPVSTLVVFSLPSVTINVEPPSPVFPIVYTLEKPVSASHSSNYFMFTLLKYIDPLSKNQVYKIKVRLIKSWSLTYSKLKYQKLMIELVMMDEMFTKNLLLILYHYALSGDRIQCTIRNPLRRPFEDLSDGKVYTISNFSLSLNDQKYKPTTHSHYVIGLITRKGDTIEFTRNGKSCVYIVVELDDMKGNGKIRCTLWEEYAKMLVKHIEDQPTSEYIIIIQFEKFNLFKGSMGVSNTNCNSILYNNTDFPKNGTYVTYGTVVAIDYKSGWWYKSCKHCFHALRNMRIHSIVLPVTHSQILMFPRYIVLHL
ncbi:hypothetical protein Ahy_B06g081258 [Arachis hypogaea]|uniref:DUF223 domain-containing protein n=1 Tax=Arachis hypogaea TaxID=3818 RepID=A0A444YKP5_ARAHY|nr:hypothetical protein Ahy_B06g081258 [Arachis hypogaea]